MANNYTDLTMTFESSNPNSSYDKRVFLSEIPYNVEAFEITRIRRYDTSTGNGFQYRETWYPDVPFYTSIDYNNTNTYNLTCASNHTLPGRLMPYDSSIDFIINGTEKALYYRVLSSSANVKINKGFENKLGIESNIRFWYKKVVTPDPTPDPTPNPTQPVVPINNGEYNENISLPSASILDKYTIRLSDETSATQVVKVLSDELSMIDPIIFGTITKDNKYDLYYNGDGNPGLIISIHAIGQVSGLMIFDLATEEYVSISDEKLKALTGSGIIGGDTIIINTNRLNKSATLIRGGKSTNILNTLERPLKWFSLSKGSNEFTYSATYGNNNLQFTITNDLLYEGL